MDKQIWHAWGECLKTSLRGATEEYRGVANVDGVVVLNVGADGAPNRTEEKLTVSASTACVCPAVDSVLGWN